MLMASYCPQEFTGIHATKSVLREMFHRVKEKKYINLAIGAKRMADLKKSVKGLLGLDRASRYSGASEVNVCACADAVGAKRRIVPCVRRKSTTPRTCPS